MGMNVITMLENDDGSSGLNEKLKGTNGSARVALPHNSYGTMVIGEVAGDTAALATGYDIVSSSGIKGCTIKSVHIDAQNATNQSALGYITVAFNNTAYNDPLVAGKRFIIPLGEEFTINFPNSPRPTKISLASYAATGAAGVDNANESIISYRYVQE